MDIFSRSNYEVAELTWENGQLAMHGIGVLQPTSPARAEDTLESIVHQATYHKPSNMNSLRHDQNNANTSSIVGSSSGGNSSRILAVPGPVIRKQTWTESDQSGRYFSSSVQEERMNQSACASASAMFCRDNDRTMMTWASFESPMSLKTKVSDEDSACQDENCDDDGETKGERGRSHSTRRSRAAAIHNQSERRRRDRINQKMKALQKLVPNSSKTDKASMLDEVIEYLKQLQGQIQMMNTVRNMPQMMLPMGMQNHHHLQMSLLARMAGMGALGMGMGMVDVNNMARTASQSLSPHMHPSPVSPPAAPTFGQSPFVLPTMIPTGAPTQMGIDPSSNSVPMHDLYSTLLAQSMNMDMYNKMAALYRQQHNQTTHETTNQSQSNRDQRI